MRLLFLCLPFLIYGESFVCVSFSIRNEEGKISERLESVKDIADCISISDLGASKKTISLIEEFAQSRKINCFVQKREEPNLIECAQSALEKFGFPLSNSYILSLEPGQIVSPKSSIRKESLTENSYLVLENNRSYRSNLIKASLSSPVKPTSKIRSLKIEEISAKGTTETISDFEERLKKPGTREELWFARYMIGLCYEDQGNWSDALAWYLDAFQFYPDRSEPLKRISTYYRNFGKNDLAYLFAHHGIQIPHLDDNLLFPPPPLQDYQFDEDLSIVTFYTRFREEGYQAASDLLLRKGTPTSIVNQTYMNLLFYTKHIQGSFQKVAIQEPKDYHPMNPSIVKTEEGYKLICRTVNYTQNGAKNFQSSDPTGAYITRNFLIEYDKNFNILSQNEITEKLLRERYRNINVQGLEDCRIFEYKRDFWFSCTTYDTNPSGGNNISLCRIQRDAPFKVDKLIPLEGPDLTRIEKNWLPFIYNSELVLLYSYDPFTLFTPNFVTGECTTALHYTHEFDFSRFRGSAAPIPFDGGHLMLIHEVASLPDYSRVYLHRFVFLDANFRANRISKPFTFNHQGVEFCLSMTLDHAEKNLIMPIGIEDREAYLVTVELDVVRSMLGPLPSVYASF